jgi:two-component system, chemotaxis family, protein-glutamate methylesterase/glutaminase
MIGRNIIVIGASAGGIPALSELVAGLPEDLNAAVFIVLHIGAARSCLPHILSRVSRLPVANALDGEAVVPGRIYVAPPDLHMLLEGGRIRLVRGPKENFTRPAIDPLFRSAALACGARVVGVVLTGLLRDGTAGLLAIKDRGGIAIVQDPEEALAPSMPQSAIARVQVDHCCPVAAMPALLVGYDPPDLPPPAPSILMEAEHRMTTMETYLTDEAALEASSEPSPLTCPECHRVLYRLEDPRLLRFRCRAGHSMTGSALLAFLGAAREDAIWSAVRSLTEEASLARELDARGDLSGGAARAKTLIESAANLRATLAGGASLA